MTATIGLAISRSVLLNANQRLHWAEKARRTRAIRDQALVMARFERPTTTPTWKARS